MMQKKYGHEAGGYMTVFLALTMTVLLSLCLVLIEGVRANAIRVETECVVDIGLDSILAEYHRELVEQYNLFAIDSSYGTVNSDVSEMRAHLQEYLDKNFSQEDVFLEDFLYKDFLAIQTDTAEMIGASILTDGKGAVFRRNATAAIYDDSNLALLQELQQWLQVVEDNGLCKRDVAAEKRAADAELQKYNGKEIQIADMEFQVVHIDNPTAKLEQMRKGILPYVVEDVNLLSDKNLQSGELLAARMERNLINKGNLPVEKLTESESMLERFLFQEYLLRYMGRYSQEKEKGALSYQVEYLLRGNDNDVTNLRETVNLLLAVREAANVTYLYSDREKCGQAEAAALLITNLLGVPEASNVLKNVLLLGWSFAESMHDVEVLLSGGKIPLLKDATGWHYDMQHALQYGGEAVSEGASVGLAYEDYLRIFMMFVDLDTLTARAMNMVEADVRLTTGNQFFRLDNCYTVVEFCIGVESKYGYKYEITRRKSY